MKPTIEIEGLEIVIVGTFNPPIFNPDWLARQELIQKGEAEKASIEFISPEVSVFSLGWAGFQVARESAVFNTNQNQNFEVLRDLVCGIFKFLRFTPLQRFGLNRIAHFKMANREESVQVSDRLTPKGDWNGVMENPSLLSLSMQGARSDGYVGNINVTVEPSVRIPNGIFIRVNDHYELGDSRAGEESSCEKLVRILNAVFAESDQRFKKIATTAILK